MFFKIPLTQYTSHLSILIYSLGIISSIIFQYENKIKRSNKAEFYILIGFISIASVAILTRIQTTISMYVLLELQTIASAILISSNGNDKGTSEASIKYIIFNSIASIIILLGITALYLHYGNFYLIQKHYNSNSVGNLLLIIGILMKLGVFPFHTWFVDIYSGIKISSINVINTIPKISLIYCFYYIYQHSYFNIHIQNSLIIFIIIGLLFASIRCIMQRNIQRIIGYSGSVNIAILMLLILLNPSNMQNIEYNIYYYLVAYTIANSLLTIAIVNTTSKHNTLYDIFCNTNYITKIFLTISLTSILGIPPMLGFFAKVSIISNIIIIKSILSIIAIISILFSTVLGSYYYMNILIKSIQQTSKHYDTKIQYIDYIAYILGIFILFGFMIF